MNENMSGFQPTDVTDRQSLILPTKRETLLMKLNKFKTNNLSAKEQVDYKERTAKLTDLFIRLCDSKLSITEEQLKQLEQPDLNELAVMIFEQSKTYAFVHTSILMCLPMLGWVILCGSLETRPSENIYWHNMRYYWWCRRMKNKYGRDFEPKLD